MNRVFSKTWFNESYTSIGMPSAGLRETLLAMDVIFFIALLHFKSLGINRTKKSHNKLSMGNANNSPAKTQAKAGAVSPRKNHCIFNIPRRFNVAHPPNFFYSIKFF